MPYLSPQHFPWRWSRSRPHPPPRSLPRAPSLVSRSQPSLGVSLTCIGIEVSLTGTPVSLTGPPVSEKIELQFPAADTLRVYALVKEIRKAISASCELRCYSSPTDIADYSGSSHGWLSFYPVTPVAAVSPAESTSSTPSNDTTPAIDESKAGDNEQYPNPYVEGFSRQGFLRNRLFSRQEKWSTRDPVR